MSSHTKEAGAQRIGLFGGTFDPVHFGHLRPAVELAERFELDKLHLVPNHRPVHRGPARANTQHRIAMLELATQPTDHLVVDTREALRDEPSYTFDTLSRVRDESPEATLIFFMGLDAFAQFDTWHQWEDILTIANLVVVGRPEAAHSAFSAALLAKQQSGCGERIRDHYCGVIEQCDVTQLAISATDIRRRIGQELTVRFLLPERVTEYIVQNQLYLPPQ